jgi:hypothetical protein
VPPCFDVYIWVRADDRRAALSRFVARHVDVSNPGDPRFEAFHRTYLEEAPSLADASALAGHDVGAGFTLYLRANLFHGAIVTRTDEGDVVLGLSIDVPPGDPGMTSHAAALLHRLMEEFDGRAGIGGVELPPPRSVSEWIADDQVLLRAGSI